jgi:hypothetical protein
MLGTKRTKSMFKEEGIVVRLHPPALRVSEANSGSHDFRMLLLTAKFQIKHVMNNNDHDMRAFYPSILSCTKTPNKPNELRCAAINVSYWG